MDQVANNNRDGGFGVGLGVNPPMEAALLREQGKEGARTYRVGRNSRSPQRGTAGRSIEMARDDVVVQGSQDENQSPKHLEETTPLEMYSTVCNVLNSFNVEDNIALRNHPRD